YSPLHLSMALHSPSPPLFPYTTLFRSGRRRRERPRDRTIVHRDGPPVAKLGRQLRVARDQPGGTRRGEHRDGERHLRRLRVLERSEEHTSELQSRFDLVCRLLLEKKKP